MKYFTAISAGLALAGLTAAAPLELLQKKSAVKSAAELIGEVAPNSLSCSGAVSVADCRTNMAVAQPFIDAFQKYKLEYNGQIAAVLALTAFETTDYKYKHNVSPGRPGQGTSNMQMINYNIEYANSIPELKDKVAALGTIDTDAKKNSLLALVTDDKYNYGSGPWFLTTQCPKVVDQFAPGNDMDAAFNAYMACVGVTATPDRLAYWTRAKTAFYL
ncbi:hypothetical protein F5Y03DRAFT_367159 [Xylaria venustula]|nr:hypothetical protein F5Y03DRAFT_367159 [Xylaria venustula]